MSKHAGSAMRERTLSPGTRIAGAVLVVGCLGLALVGPAEADSTYPEHVGAAGRYVQSVKAADIADAARKDNAVDHYAKLAAEQKRKAAEERRKAAERAAARASRSSERAAPQTFSGTRWEQSRQWANTAKARAVAQCESGGSPTAVNPTGKYRGKWQMDKNFWSSYGGLNFASRPDLATEAEQDLVAYNGYLARGWRPWSCA